jgi:hypothetical protein
LASSRNSRAFSPCPFQIPPHSLTRLQGRARQSYPVSISSRPRLSVLDEPAHIRRYSTVWRTRRFGGFPRRPGLILCDRRRQRRGGLQLSACRCYATISYFPVDQRDGQGRQMYTPRSRRDRGLTASVTAAPASVGSALRKNADGSARPPEDIAQT